MPLTYDIDEELGRVTFTGTGTLTDEDMFACIRNMRLDSRLKPGMNRLTDCRDVEEFSITPDGYQRVISLMQGTGNADVTAKNALMISNDVGFGVGRMFSLMSEDRTDVQFQVFRDMQEALDWLAS